MKISNNFTVRELVHPDIVNKLGEKRAANLVSPHLLVDIERLRNQFGKITINDYEWGGKFKNSGIRTASYYTSWGVMTQSYSTHQWGTTADLKFSNGIRPTEVYDYILANPEQFSFIVRMENAYLTKTWLHIECGKYREDKIEVFNP